MGRKPGSKNKKAVKKVVQKVKKQPKVVKETPAIEPGTDAA